MDNLNVGFMKFVLVSFFVFLNGCATFGDRNNDIKLELAKMEQIESLTAVGEKLYVNGQLTMASKYFKDILDLDVDNVPALYRLGNINFRREKLDRAIGYFQRVITINPRHAKSHYNIAVIDLMKAERHFQLYVATASASQDLSKITDILSDINAFATNEQSRKELKLEKMWQALEHR